MMPKLLDVLTKQERKEIYELKTSLIEAKTLKDIKYYGKQIDDILDKAEKRYYNMKQPDTSLTSENSNLDK